MLAERMERDPLDHDQVACRGAGRRLEDGAQDVVRVDSVAAGELEHRPGDALRCLD